MVFRGEEDESVFFSTLLDLRKNTVTPGLGRVFQWGSVIHEENEIFN